MGEKENRESRADAREKVTVVVEKGGERVSTESFILGKLKIVIVVNNQFTNAPNTTQIASGAGRSSAAGNNAAIDSSNTLQQQSVGAGGEADNSGMDGEQSEPHQGHRDCADDNEIVIVINNQINEPGPVPGRPESSATQVASGGGVFSASGTNSAVESSNTKQQHAVGGGPDASAENSGMNDRQQEV